VRQRCQEHQLEKAAQARHGSFMSAQAVLEEALHLSPDQRLALAERLWESVHESVAQSRPEPDWQLTELKRRMDAHERGELETISHEEVLAELPV
jgi:putative addiction module component (TIGR02574 family)